MGHDMQISPCGHQCHLQVARRTCGSWCPTCGDDALEELEVDDDGLVAHQQRRRGAARLRIQQPQVPRLWCIVTADMIQTALSH